MASESSYFDLKKNLFDSIFMSFVESTHEYSLSIIVFCIHFNSFWNQM